MKLFLNLKSVMIVAATIPIFAPAQDVKAGEIPDSVKSNILPMKDILARARARKASGERVQEAASDKVFFLDESWRSNRVYMMTEIGLRPLEAVESEARLLNGPLDQKAADAQNEADANDGADQTGFEEIGATLDPEHLQSFRLCSGMRSEQGLNTLNTYWMALLSDIAYLKYPIAFQRLKQMGFEKIFFIEGASDVEVIVAKIPPKRDAQGIPLPETGLSVVSFRGTDNVEDWLTNLRATTTDISAHSNEAWLHEGFALALDEVYSNILRVLKLDSDPSPLFITGHSLGGALGIQLALRLVSQESATARPWIGPQDSRLRGVYTFAAPRVGNEWARLILDRYMNRTRNVAVHLHFNADPVTKVPFDWMGYRRFALQIVLPYDAENPHLNFFGDRSRWVCHGEMEYKGPSALSWDFLNNDVESHRMRSFAKHFVEWRSQLADQSCQDATPEWGPRFQHEDPQNYKPLRLPRDVGRSACDYQVFSWRDIVQI